ncbi:hypothetical protein [Kitasatospora cheerisanensis]|uniref:Peptidase S1 domain-containing protein n=1 Tax=Kitasatospora cheerisanensis KCTC 2395 TaxID=1348663 RepID=A0A066YG52_9ACTN|nr:hypothetical protein [Kitasatospora cheerisanensis]KDN80473.1 hypothetical protein KCH_77610 [Kitasatospora cheerisanensis KCTC 2395]
MRKSKIRALMAASTAALALGFIAPAAHARTDVNDQSSKLPAVETGVDRNNDTAPYSGGGRFYTAPSGGCSTGFGVHKSGEPATTAMLTVAHCFDAVGDEAFADSGNSHPIGTVSTLDAYQDAALVTMPSGANIFDGPAGPGAFHKQVIGVHRPQVGDSLCVSGATSGIKCGLRVSSITDSGAVALDWSWFSEPPFHGGDSGGPLFVLGPKPGTVYAAGLVHGYIGTPMFSIPEVVNICNALNATKTEINVPPGERSNQADECGTPQSGAPASPEPQTDPTSGPNSGPRPDQSPASPAPQSQILPPDDGSTTKPSTVTGIVKADPMPLREGPGLGHPRIRDLQQGMTVTVDCFTDGGQQLWGWGGQSPYWDHATVQIGDRTLTGYLADVWVDTGVSIDRTGIPRCAN